VDPASRYKSLGYIASQTALQGNLLAFTVVSVPLAANTPWLVEGAHMSVCVFSQLISWFKGLNYLVLIPWGIGSYVRGVVNTTYHPRVLIFVTVVLFVLWAFTVSSHFAFGTAADSKQRDYHSERCAHMPSLQATGPSS
jgi:hypothetical protein